MISGRSCLVAYALVPVVGCDLAQSTLDPLAAGGEQRPRARTGNRTRELTSRSLRSTAAMTR
jgi:hypothetical protein